MIEQVVHVSQTTILQDAWGRGQPVEVHGVVYRLEDGILRNLGIRVSGPEELEASYQKALAQLSAQ